MTCPARARRRALDDGAVEQHGRVVGDREQLGGHRPRRPTRRQGRSRRQRDGPGPPPPREPPGVVRLGLRGDDHRPGPAPSPPRPRWRPAPPATAGPATVGRVGDDPLPADAGGVAGGHSGTLPCLRLGSSSRLVRSIVEAAGQHRPGVGRVDHVVDEAPLGGHVGVGEALGVLLDQLGLAGPRGRPPRPAPAGRRSRRRPGGPSPPARPRARRRPGRRRWTWSSSRRRRRRRPCG